MFPVFLCPVLFFLFFGTFRKVSGWFQSNRSECCWFLNCCKACVHWLCFFEWYFSADGSQFLWRHFFSLISSLPDAWYLSKISVNLILLDIYPVGSILCFFHLFFVFFLLPFWSYSSVFQPNRFLSMYEFFFLIFWELSVYWWNVKILWYICYTHSSSFQNLQKCNVSLFFLVRYFSCLLFCEPRCISSRTTWSVELISLVYFALKFRSRNILFPFVISICPTFLFSLVSQLFSKFISLFRWSCSLFLSVLHRRSNLYRDVVCLWKLVVFKFT